MPAHPPGFTNNLINVFDQTSVDDFPKIHHPKMTIHHHKAGADQYGIYLDAKKFGYHEVKTVKGIMLVEEHKEKKGLYGWMPRPFRRYELPAYNTSTLPQFPPSVVVTVTTTLAKADEAGLNENCGGKPEKLGTGDFKKSDFGSETNQMVMNQTVQVYYDDKKDKSYDIIVNVNNGFDSDRNEPIRA